MFALTVTFNRPYLRYTGDVTLKDVQIEYYVITFMYKRTYVTIINDYTTTKRNYNMPVQPKCATFYHGIVLGLPFFTPLWRKQ